MLSHILMTVMFMQLLHVIHVWSLRLPTMSCICLVMLSHGFLYKVGVQSEMQFAVGI